jgi:hypothetical protein
VARYAAIPLAATVVLLAACGGQGPATVTATEPVDTTPPAETAPPAEPEEAPVAVVERIIELDSSDPDFHTEGFRGGEDVTRAFVQKVDDAAAEAEAQGAFLDYDPILCAQQIPRDAGIVRESIDGDRAVVVALLEYGMDSSNTVTYEMAVEDGRWKLDGTECLG